MGSSLTDEEYPKAVAVWRESGRAPVEPRRASASWSGVGAGRDFLDFPESTASGVERAPHGRHEDPSAEEAQVEVRAARFATVGIPTSLS